MGTIIRDGLSYSEAGKLGAQKSASLRQELYIKRVGNYKLNPKLCAACLKPLTYEQRFNDFCTRTCSATFHNRDRIVKKTCNGCGNEIVGYTDSQYCHRECFLRYLRRQRDETDDKYIKEWQAGKEKGWFGPFDLPSLSPRVRRYIFAKFDYKCCKCGWNVKNSFTGKSPLQINHIDGNARNCQECNLELICPNCHSLTENWGSRNKNGVRKGRRRYGQ